MRAFTRRQFLTTTAVAGVSVSIAPLARRVDAALLEEQRLRPLAWDEARSAPRFRIDGIAKVTGEKLFARDMRAHDLAGWPQQQAHALVLRAERADCRFAGLALDVLGPALAPDRAVTAADLARDGLALPAFYGDEMLLTEGQTPAYLGHPVAILIWREFARYRLAQQKLRQGAAALRYGEPTGPRVRPPWGAMRAVRAGGAQPGDADAHSPLLHGLLFPDGFDGERPRWPAPAAEGDPRARAVHHAQAIARALDAPARGVRVFEREFFSQSTDTAALEPDNANGWYDRERRALHLVVASQSPQEVAAEAAAMVARCGFPVEKLSLHPCYTVGYGSKDHHAQPFYGLVAALYADGVPVRLANDRYEQFQSALKRHSFRMRYRLAVEEKSGRFRALRGDLVADGGGRANFSPSVALVAATSAQSIYYFPSSDLEACAIASRAPDAGSARGYGTLQSMSAMEMLVDEIAGELRLDPIELRLRNALRSGMKNSQGALAAGVQRAHELLERARQHPLWSARAQRKAEHEAAHPGERYGVGFACVQKDFGTGAEAAFAALELSAQGRIRLRHIAVEIGTGTSTAQAALCARWLGRPADEVRTAQTDWPELPLHTSGDPWSISQAEQDRAAQDPLWTPFLATPTSASNSAYYYGHSTLEAARLVFEFGLWPAALSIWGEGVGGGAAAPLALRREDARWVGARLTAAGLSPLSLEELAARAHARGWVTGACVHAFNRWQWAQADFELEGELRRLPLDALALRRGGAAFQLVPRVRAHYPEALRNGAGTTYYAAAATLVELAVRVPSGEVALLSHHSLLECGSPLVEALISGQIQGGVAMGIGHALHEVLPLYEGGPGAGDWNFDRYRLPRASDVAVWSQTSELLPPLSDSDPPKGIAEVTVIPVIAAIANAVAHATGVRFRELPLRPETIAKGLV